MSSPFVPNYEAKGDGGELTEAQETAIASLASLPACLENQFIKKTGAGTFDVATVVFPDVPVASPSASGESDHGLLSGLQDDDHLQYFNAARFDAAFAAKTTADLAASTNKNYVTDAQLTALAGISGTNTGDVTIGTANGLSLIGQAFSLAAASGSVTGALSSADWTTFNGKQSALGYAPLNPANNLSDVANVGTARTSLGLGSLATQSGTFSGTSSGTNTGDQTTVSGNAGSATVLQNARNINGVSFNGSGDITVASAAGTLTGATLAAGVLASSLTSVGILTALTSSGAILSTGAGGVGYSSGSGGTVTQLTSKVTGVTLNKICGRITMHAAALAAAAEVAFVLTNSTIAATDVVVVCVQSVGTAGAYFVTVGAVSAGSCSITIGNASAGSLSQAVVLSFAVIKSAIA